MDAPKGLEGVVVAETEVGDVRGQEGFYHYRQYNAVELAEKRSLEDVWYLLFEGELPTKEQRERFIEEKNRTGRFPTGQGFAAGHCHRRRALHAARRPAQPRCRCSRTPRTSSPASTSARRSCAATLCRSPR